MANLNDQSPMPFGTHKGKKMEDVPASYLLWLWNQGCQNQDVAAYIAESMSALKLEYPDTITDR
jgi:uncharacterized protein (DUF3820 family)